MSLGRTILSDGTGGLGKSWPEPRQSSPVRRIDVSLANDVEEGYEGGDQT